MSSEEEFEVEEILEQRKRKGVLEYLVRWRGFNDLYDSWEPASGLSDCTNALKAFAAKLKAQRSRSKSRSRSRGRASKSRSRSTSRGRATKSDTTPKRSRSRSGGRKSSKSSSKIVSEVAVTSKESASGEPHKSSRLRSAAQAEETTAVKKTETVTVEKKSVAAKEEQEEIVEKKTEVVKTTVSTVKAMPVTREESSSGMVTRSRLAVRQVQNDQKPTTTKAGSAERKEKETWVWWFADHAVLVLFIVVSVIALSFTIESISGVRDKLVPDMGVLRQRLSETVSHFVEGVTSLGTSVTDAMAGGFTRVKAAIFAADDSASAPTPSASSSPAA